MDQQHPFTCIMFPLCNRAIRSGVSLTLCQDETYQPLNVDIMSAGSYSSHALAAISVQSVSSA